MNIVASTNGASLYAVKLRFLFTQIGDQVCATGLPEIIYQKTGKKSVITDERIWAFKHNPYVIFMSEEESQGLPEKLIAPDSRDGNQQKSYIEQRNTFQMYSQSEYMALNFNMPDVHLRHPKLYVNEENDIIPNKIIVHTTGSDRTRLNENPIRYSSGEDAERVMSDIVIHTILKNYKNFDIIQIGGETDKPLGGHSTNLCGKLDYWEVAEQISTASRFIGVNSGPMHIANCYPRVDKRIVLMEFPKQTLIRFQPGDVRNWLFSWIDTTNTYFNKTLEDVGTTYSYTKI